MNKKSSGGFVRQAAILAGASLFVRMLGFFYRIPLTILIGDEGNAFYSSAYQIYAFALTLTSVFMIATISRLTSERIAQGQYQNAHRLFKTAMGFSIILGTVGSLLLFFGAIPVINFFSDDGPFALFFSLPEGSVYAIRAVAPAVFIVSMLTVFRGYFQGMNTAFPTAISQVVEQVFNVAFSLWLAFLFFDSANPHSVRYAAAGATAGTAIAALSALAVVAFIYLLVSKSLKRRADEDTTDFKEKPITQLSTIIRTAYPMIIGLSIISISGILDIGMANSRIMASGAFMDDEVNILIGQFTGKFVLFTTLPVSISMALSSAVIPEITASHVTLDEDAVREKTNLALRLSMMISIPAAVGISVLADPIIAMLIPLHPEGGWLLRYGGVSIVFMALVHVITGVLQGCGHIKLPALALFIGVVIKIILNYYLMAIPSINILGAVISTIVCFFVASIINLVFLRRFTGIFPDFKATFLKPLSASLGMGFVCFIVYSLLSIISPNAIATLGAIVFGFLSYVLLMVLLRGFGERELNAIPIPYKIRRWLNP
ncbi:MAG: polysaccharide biosynthesis protein [Defluviitaleaceae bacterium]|nr:polysaccharide biosynthesis protein [Defluviitaleaceae bacterium]